MLNKSDEKNAEINQNNFNNNIFYGNYQNYRNFEFRSNFLINKNQF